MRNRSFQDKSGSAMVAAIFVAVVIGLWMAVAMQSSYTEYKMSSRYLDMQNALNIAESGLEEAVRAFQEDDWTGWTSYSNGYYVTGDADTLINPESLDLFSGSVGTLTVFIDDTANNPVIAAEGSIVGADGNELSRQVLVELSTSSLFANGLLARNAVVMNGNNIVVDSYDSRNGDYTPGTNSNRNSNGNVGSLSFDNSDVSLNNADIYGFIAVGGTFDVDASFHRNGTLGEWGDSGGTKDLTRVTEDFTADLPPVEEPSYGSWTDVSVVNGGSSSIDGPLTLGSPTDTSPAEYVLDEIKLSGNGDDLVIDGPVTLYVRNGVSISGKGSIQITSNGSLELYSDDDVSITGNGSAYGLQNETKKPEKFMVYNSDTTEGATTVKVAGNGKAYVVVYAPNSDVQLSGGGSSGTVHGAIVGYDITLSGGYEFHYDEALADLNGDAGLNINYWRELKGVGERLTFGTPATLNSEIGAL
ncbi:pilus assembly PilX family protein [Pelagicoccus mobilis]|uniref:DUF7305 domain-containing protein n=1 Tax=Pelagicoccus mobilis TaxID=415221 RepID=A0A934S099_9BACT|nr:hypothetical protein [Pelagicoccus mobilis]MBK1879941.1 hypothetical protein [Pelagicoccus mobilis]